MSARNHQRPRPEEAVDDDVRGVVVRVLAHGWTPTDLAEVVSRRLTSAHLPALVGLLVAETDRHPPDRVCLRWRDDLAGIDAAAPLDLPGGHDRDLVLDLARLLVELPPITRTMSPPGVVADASVRARSGADERQLARVRALLAKAESTQFAEEAEALSAKAQELVSRHALDRLVDAPDRLGASTVTARRIWIDPPYVAAKASLIGAVARANGCRAVVSESLGFATVVGDPPDLESVELVSTSLLVQADVAMLGHGSRTDRSGTTRTRSFRRSFLMAYATRIGERLREAAARAAADVGRQQVLLPALVRRDEAVEVALGELFPVLRSVRTRVSNGEGWVAGRAAADRARLEGHRGVTA